MVLGYLCPTCSQPRAQSAGRPCFFCDAKTKIEKLGRDLGERHQAHHVAHQAREVKQVHRFRNMTARGQKGR